MSGHKDKMIRKYIKKKQFLDFDKTLNTLKSLGIRLRIKYALRIILKLGYKKELVKELKNSEFI